MISNSHSLDRICQGSSLVLGGIPTFTKNAHSWKYWLVYMSNTPKITNGIPCIYITWSCLRSFWITKVSLILFTALLYGYPVISWFTNFLVRFKDGQVFSTIKLEFGLGLFSVSLKKFHDNFAWISLVFLLHLLDLGLDFLVADFLHHFMMNPCYNILW